MGKIYKIINLKTNKEYIGQTKNCVSQRFCQHIDGAFRKSLDIQFYKDIVGLGEDIFKYMKYEILEECDNDKLNEREIYWIKEIKPGYNTSHRTEIFGKLYSKEIQEKYKQGYTITELRKEYKCRHNTIKKILIDNNIKVLRCKPKQEKRKEIYYFDEYGELIRRYNYVAELANDLQIKQGNPRLCALSNQKKGFLYYTCNGKYVSYDKEQPYIYKIHNDSKNIEILCKTKKAVELEIKKLTGQDVCFSKIRRKGRKKYYGYEIIEMMGDDDNENLA